MDTRPYKNKTFDDPENFIHKDLILDEAIKEKINDLGMCTAGKFFRMGIKSYKKGEKSEIYKT